MEEIITKSPRRQINIRLTEDEQTKLQERLKENNITNASRFCKRMMLHGFILKLDDEVVNEMRSIVKLLGNATSNINQIAKRANATSNIYAEDLEEIWKEYSALSDKYDELFMMIFNET